MVNKIQNKNIIVKNINSNLFLFWFKKSFPESFIRAIVTITGIQKCKIVASCLINLNGIYHHVQCQSNIEIAFKSVNKLFHHSGLLVIQVISQLLKCKTGNNQNRFKKTIISQIININFIFLLLI